MATKTKTVGKTTKTIQKGVNTMEQIQFKDVSRQATDREYLASRIKTTCELITTYINIRVTDEQEIEPIEVYKDFRDKEQLMSLLVIGNYLDKKLDTITKSSKKGGDA